MRHEIQTPVVDEKCQTTPLGLGDSTKQNPMLMVSMSDARRLSRDAPFTNMTSNHKTGWHLHEALQQQTDEDEIDRFAE